MRIDKYYRNFLSTTLPNRTPFSRSGEKDSGHYFIYMTNSKRWSLLLDRSKLKDIESDAERNIPVGYNQLWLFKKIFSTKRWPRKQMVGESVAGHRFSQEYPAGLERKDWPHRLYVVLREPYDFSTVEGDIISFGVEESKAINDANIYTLLKYRRSIVGLMIWDLQWH